MFTENSSNRVDYSDEFVPSWMDTEERRQIVTWAEDLVARFHTPIPPIDVEWLAVKVGIKEIHRANISADGIMLPTQDGFILTINENNNPTRQRFTCAHEIAHTYFEPLDRELRVANHRQNAMIGTCPDNLEHLCDIAATHILMPDQMFRQAALRFGVSIDAIDYLADIFQTSIQATALRFVEISREPIILMLSQIYDKPESTPKLRVRWSSQKSKTSGLSSYFIPPFVPIDEESKTHQAYKTDGICRGFENFNIANLKGAYYTEAKSFGSADNKYVISLVFLEAQTKRLI